MEVAFNTMLKHQLILEVLVLHSLQVVLMELCQYHHDIRTVVQDNQQHVILLVVQLLMEEHLLHTTSLVFLLETE